MNSAIFCLSLLICSLSAAQDYGNFTEDCYPNMCELLKVSGALMEKLTSADVFTPLSENRLSQCESRQEASATRLRSFESTLTDFEKRVQTLERRGGMVVTFSAVTGGEDEYIGYFNTDTTLIYTKVITNIGEAYNQFSGFFTAPVAGVYYFTFFYNGGGTSPSVLHLYKNDERIVTTEENWTYFDPADNGGNAVFLHLQRFDQVYVVLGAGSRVWDSNYHTTFSGFLVIPMWET